MGEVKALIDREAITKMRQIAGSETAMLCTFSGAQTMNTRPMGTLAIDDAGSFWFFSCKDSSKNRELSQNGRVQLVYSVPGKSEYMSIEGTAKVSRDQRKIDQLWNPICKAWFPDGKNDPNITVIQVSPSGGHYWDTKHGTMITFAAIAASALTGKQLDAGVEGDLKV
jgi:general stress protein 26